MSKKKKKFFVVWQGYNPGIYETWKECQIQTKGYSQAKYKGFPTLSDAKKAFADGYENYWGKNTFISPLSENEIKLIEQPIKNAMTVDAACQGVPGIMEYQGVDFFTGETIFRQGPFPDSTNNIGEYLALVHALAHMKKLGDDRPIYSDSKIAMGWIKNKGHRTKHQESNENKKSFDLLRRADKWLKENSFSNKILKWETKAWGEIPADFGRK